MAEITKIDKLNGKNYQSWKYNVKLVLMERGLWGFTQEGKEIPPDEDATNAVKNAFQLRSDKAYSLIALNVEKHLQIHISSTTDPLAAWTNLQKQFEFVSVTQVVRLNRKFYAATMEEGGDLMKHLTYMTSLAEQQREMEEDISSKKFATVVLGSLPKSYDNLLTSLNARKAEELEWDNIKGLLIEEYLKRKEKFENNKSDNALLTNRKSYMSRGRNYDRRRHDYKPSWNTNKGGDTLTPVAQQQRDDGRARNILCFKCNKAGHIARNCPLNNRKGGNKGEHSKLAEGGGVALISSTGNSNEWYVDSAATKHMTNRKDLIINYTQYQTPVNIYLGDNTCIKALGEGMVKLYTQNDNTFYLELHKVLNVPMLAKNLLSVPAMASMGAKVSFDDEKCVVSKEEKEYVIGKLVDGMLYTVNPVEFSHPTTEPLDMWHQRFGHLNNGYVNQLMKNDMVTGMMYDESKQVEKDCKGCSMGKMHKNPFPKASLHRASRPYEIIHTDICGPMQVESIGGSRYLVTFTDDYSRYAVAYFIKKKDEALTKFKEFVNYVENQDGNHNKVKILRSDNGGEYRSNSFSKFCTEKGIVQQFTCPYTPEQNAVAERINRTILESARSMIYHANLPLVFWAEACNTAVYLHNRSPTVALKDKTPHECLFGEKTDVSNLKVFGCMCYVHIPDSNRRKLDQKSYEAIFVGYPTGTKGYKVYDVKRRKSMISRDVQFLEKKFHNFENPKNDFVFKQQERIEVPDDEKQTVSSYFI
ncbi:Retrovirus-related Pol poly from transposon TNT 1-94 [Paramuricea clavata]|uniref:Retrovirus-related Pol poly from transposon TNT 1-94 n=1 Tax=Paramuricea clavata TaxID=317549 RepID=A0A7D9J2X8_PARCT|nr:Retrovirus-related Pol poly from transposon TNT 1-94 [Paramuricea clavata]